MPIFEYKCLGCGEHTEILLRGLPADMIATPICCDREMERVVCAPSIRFKGSGFYVNDYKEEKRDAV